MNSASLVIAGAASLLLASACTTLFPPSNPVRYYGLAPVPPATSAVCAVRFGVRPVVLPGYVDRDEILIERRGTELVLSNTQLWAAPLRNELTRTLGDSLALRWRESRFVAHPWRFGEAPTWAVDAAFEQLDPAAGALLVRVRWSVSALSADQPVTGSAAAPSGPQATGSQATGPQATSPPAAAMPSQGFAGAGQSPRGEVAVGRFEARIELAAPSAGSTADAIAQAVGQLADRVATEGKAAMMERDSACR